MTRLARGLLSLVSAAGALFLAGSWIASRRLADRLLSATGLGETPDTGAELLAALRAAAPIVEAFRHPGSALDPVDLAATFASPGDPASRATLLFLHGKGGRASEWRPDAVRALALGYNVLLPDLRGHGASAGRYMTFGVLEKGDLSRAIDGIHSRWGADPFRIALHSCSAGSAIALELARDRGNLLAIWLESPFAEPREMARHYLSAATGIPAPLLALTTRWAVSRNVARVRRDLGLDATAGGLERADPLAAMRSVTCPVALVYGASDRLVPPRFVEKLIDVLPPGSEVFRAEGAGHCHHPNEVAQVAREEYERRWRSFFERHAPVSSPLSPLGRGSG